MTKITTLLQFNWEEVIGLSVAAVLGTRPQAMSNGSLVCDQIALVVGGNAVVMSVNDDTDEVIVSLEEAARTGSPEWQTLDQLSEIVLCRLGWCWVGRNYLGYLDTFTIAIDGIDPAYSFTGVASSLQCTRVTPIAA